MFMYSDMVIPHMITCKWISQHKEISANIKIISLEIIKSVLSKLSHRSRFCLKKLSLVCFNILDWVKMVLFLMKNHISVTRNLYLYPGLKRISTVKSTYKIIIHKACSQNVVLHLFLKLDIFFYIIVCRSLVSEVFKSRWVS